MSWEPGTIILCIDDSGPKHRTHEWVVAGQYYTVRSRCHDINTGAPGVRLAEIVMDLCPYAKKERGWKASRFIIAESTHSEAGTVRQKEPVSA